jgi:hypothetical protein
MDLNENFREFANNTDAIFHSYPILTGVYTQAIRVLERIEGMPPAVTHKLDNHIQILQQTQSTVQAEQDRISNLLYSQGLLLLIGSSESLIKEAFKTLIIKNVSKVNATNVNFNFQELKLYLSSEDNGWLGDLLVQKLEEEKNPTEKLNFQNVQQVKGLFGSYFGVEINDDETLSRMHYYWQVRHILMHNKGRVDDRFLKNLSRAGINIERFSLQTVISIAESDYNDCKLVLKTFFEKLSAGIKSAGLTM